MSDLHLVEWKSLVRHEGNQTLWHVAWSRNAQLVATCGADRSVAVWDAHTGLLLGGIGGGMLERTVRTVDWSAEGTRLALACFDGQVRIFRLERGGRAEATVLRADDRLAGGSGGTQRSVSSGTDVGDGSVDMEVVSECCGRGIRGGADEAGVVARTPTVAVAPIPTDVPTVADDGALAYQLAPYLTLRLVARLEGHESEVKCAAFSPSGTLLATCSRDKTVWIWECGTDGDDAIDFECVAVLAGHTQDVKSLTWHPEREMIASASYDNTVRLWCEDLLDGEWYCCATLTGHESTVWSVAFEPLAGDDREARLLSGGGDGQVMVWRLEEPEADAKTNSEATSAASVTSNASQLTSWNRTREQRWVVEWHVYANADDRGFADEEDEPVYSVDWSPCGRYVAAASADGAVRVYDADTAAMVAQRRHAHRGAEVNCVRFRPRCVVEADLDEAIRTRIAAEAGDEGDREALMLASAGDDGTARLWLLL